MPEPEQVGDIICGGKFPVPRRKRQKLDLLKINWRHIAGERLGAHSVPSKLSRGVLFIKAETPSWASEVSMATDRILTKIENFGGRGYVLRIKVRAEKQAGRDLAERRERDRRDSKATEEPLENSSLEGIEDEGLRQSIERFIRSMKVAEKEDD